MPKSRGRRNRRTHDKLRARRRAGPRNQVEEDLAIAACAAFDRADVDTALRMLSAVPVLSDSSWMEEIRDLAAAGPDAPGWLWCRAVLRHAFRTQYVDEAGRVQFVAADVVGSTYGYDDPDEETSQRLLVQAVAADELVRDLALFDHGGLRRYLRSRASADLRARTPMMNEWARAERSVYQLGELRDDRLVVTDLITGDEVTLLHLGAVVGLGPSDCVLGRIAPISEEPGLMFVSRPLQLDPVTAEEMVSSWDDPLDTGRERDPVDFLSGAVATGRMPPAPGFAAGPMSLTSDLRPYPADLTDGACEPSLRARELMLAGLSAMDAQHVVAVETALEVASRTPESLPVAAAFAAVALSDDSVRAAIRRRGTGHDARCWEMLARCVQEPARGFCLEMAERDAA